MADSKGRSRHETVEKIRRQRENCRHGRAGGVREGLPRRRKEIYWGGRIENFFWFPGLAK
jgi:hypothetical protein